MAHDLEPVRDAVPGTELAPWFQAPEITTRPEWTELRVPYREDSTLERRWSACVLPLRFLALGFLWVTYSPYRFGIFLATVMLIWTVFIVR